MKQAIITGASGFIGARLVNTLLDNQVGVIALGRRDWKDINSCRLTPREGLTYIHVSMEEIESLPIKLNERKVSVQESCVFYNFAWSGKVGLSDLDVGAQSLNIAQAVNALKVAKSLGCRKFIHVGTMEEPIAENYLWLDYRKHSEFNRHTVYSLAKIAARTALKIHFNSEKKMDLIFATNSHVMGPYDDKDSFLQVTLEKLKNNHADLKFSTGEQFFDVISVHDCAKAYRLIGELGVSGSEYWIGSGSPRRLRGYVEEMASIVDPAGNSKLHFGAMSYNDISMKEEDFATSLLFEHTGFVPDYSFADSVSELYRYL